MKLRNMEWLGADEDILTQHRTPAKFCVLELCTDPKSRTLQGAIGAIARAVWVRQLQQD